MSVKIDLTGQRFNHWLVLKKDETYTGRQNTKWICRCDCGTERSVLACTLKNGRSSSCGCAPRRPGGPKKHGMTKTRIHKIWASMNERCRNRDTETSRQYYGRGIRVCEEWQGNFIKFYEWAMSHGYRDDMTIERVDVNGNYCPDNCKWISAKEQQRNKTNTIYVDYRGEKWCLGTLCAELGFPYKLAHKRRRKAIKAGKTVSTEWLLRPVEAKKIAKCYVKRG